MAVILRDAFRGLRAGKGTTLLAFPIFALAIAAGTVTFSVVDTIALRGLPFDDAGRLVAIPRIDARAGRLAAAAPQDYFAWKDRVGALESLGMYRNNVVQQWHRGEARERLSIARVTTNFFEVLRVRPAAGRLFGPDHDAAGSDAVIVLSHALWERGFGADPSALGSRMQFAQTSRLILGVLPPDVTYPIGLEPATDAYIPSIATAAERTDASPGRTFNADIVGRLRPGATIAQVQGEIDALNAARQRHATAPPDRTHLVQPLLDNIVGPARSWLLLVLAGVACVLLVACVNVASLFLARATVRMREIATREVLGASRRQIAGTLVLEGVLLSAAAGLAGIAAAYWGLGGVRAVLPKGLARASGIALDGRVLAVATTTVLVCGAAFASAPAWLASRVDVYSATRTGSASVVGGRRRARSLTTLLVGETAFVTALMVATVLIVTTFVVVTTADLGYDRRNVIAVSLQKSFETVPKDERAAAGAAFRDDVLQRVRAVPGVASAAMAESGVPLVGGLSSYSVHLPGESDPAKAPMFELRAVTPEYFVTMGIRLVSGRGFQPSDRRGAPQVGVINETSAQRFFGGRDPVGQVMTFRGPLEIVGVVRDVRAFGPETHVEPQLYIPLDQEGSGGGDLVVRTSQPAAAIAAAIRQATRAAGADDAFQPRYVDEAFARVTAGRRFNATLMTVFGGIALLVGAIGIYGTMAFVVAQDVRAIGVRLALGATPARVRRAVLSDALRRVVLGTLIGLAGAWAASGLLSSLVFGVQATSPAVFAGVAALMAGVGLVAAFVPALRASRLDPLVALRAE